MKSKYSPEVKQRAIHLLQEQRSQYPQYLATEPPNLWCTLKSGRLCCGHNHRVARCTVERLMRRHQMQGVWRGKGKRTTVADPKLQRASDLVKRRFRAEKPNQLWVKTGRFTVVNKPFAWLAKYLVWLS